MLNFTKLKNLNSLAAFKVCHKFINTKSLAAFKCFKFIYRKYLINYTMAFIGYLLDPYYENDYQFINSDIFTLMHP